jgi:hypothetical protein
MTGVCITVIGWLLSSAHDYPFVYRIVVPRYSNAISALQEMQDRDDFILRKGDSGFQEISEILKGYFEQTLGRETTQIKTLSRGSDMLETAQGANWNEYVELEVSFSNEPPLSGKFYELESRIEERYLISKALAWKGRIFGTGIAVILIAIFI